MILSIGHPLRVSLCSHISSSRLLALAEAAASLPFVGDTIRNLDSQIQKELGSLAVDTTHLIHAHFPAPSSVVNDIYTQLYNEHDARFYCDPTQRNNYCDLLRVISSCDKAKRPMFWQQNPRPIHAQPLTPSSSLLPVIAGTTNPIQFPDFGRMQVAVETHGIQAHDLGVDRLLMIHLSQLLWHCPDRRFACGIAFAEEGYFRVYIADRSGVVGSELFCINEDPKVLIGLVIGIQRASPSALGWDTSMLLIPRSLSPNVVPCTSYTVPFTLREDYHFVVAIPACNVAAPHAEGIMEQYVLFELQPMEPASVSAIVSSGIRVWNAWNVRDIALDEMLRPTYKVKDAWSTKRTEGAILSDIGPSIGVPHIYSKQYIIVERILDTTHNSRKWIVPSSELNLWSMQVEGAASLIPAKNRIHHQFVSSADGPSVYHFKSCLELAMVMQDVVAGLRSTHDRGYVHRNIGVESIVIKRSHMNPTNGIPAVRAEGELINFENAVKLEDKRDADPTIGVKWFMSAEIVDAKYMFDATIRRPKVPRYNAIHDLDALFWVVVFLAVSMAKPGGILRDELLWPSNVPTPFAIMHRNLFGRDDSRRTWTKRDVFHNPALLTNNILPYVSTKGYCASLRTVIRRYFDILLKAYQENKYDNLHVNVLEVFTDMEAVVRKSYPPLEQEVNFVRAEEKRRRNSGMVLPPVPPAFTPDETSTPQLLQSPSQAQPTQLTTPAEDIPLSSDAREKLTITIPVVRQVPQLPTPAASTPSASGSDHGTEEKLTITIPAKWVPTLSVDGESSSSSGSESDEHLEERLTIKLRRPALRLPAFVEDVPSTTSGSGSNTLPPVPQAQLLTPAAKGPSDSGSSVRVGRTCYSRASKRKANENKDETEESSSGKRARKGSA
ncbi:hypothetical protein EUX98_g8707 [Antrodiella citrinella]|uniref:Fungal-type protein kinase domain-containing protein n=1 Tax=Antrodiella citrinella TaxID=2447956 RepID=A0A4S4M3Q2_9APHY|nr:hypothetical protein EUX98_g8707 [Antrodiella citrinella]